jgi:integrase
MLRYFLRCGVAAEANDLLRERGVPEIVECTPHTLRRTYISLLLAAGCDPAYVQQQVGQTDPTLTLRIYQQLLKRKRREECWVLVSPDQQASRNSMLSCARSQSVLARD